MPRPPIEPRGLSRVEAARYLGISPSKFDELRKDGRVPPARMIDGRKVWDVRDLDAAFEALPLETNSHEDEDWSVTV
jgi:predicted DNA-binding transcriptional regulator AlpA